MKNCVCVGGFQSPGPSAAWSGAGAVCEWGWHGVPPERSPMGLNPLSLIGPPPTSAISRDGRSCREGGKTQAWGGGKTGPQACPAPSEAAPTQSPRPPPALPTARPGAEMSSGRAARPQPFPITSPCPRGKGEVGWLQIPKSLKPSHSAAWSTWTEHMASQALQSKALRGSGGQGPDSSQGPSAKADRKSVV